MSAKAWRNGLLLSVPFWAGVAGIVVALVLR